MYERPDHVQRTLDLLNHKISSWPSPGSLDEILLEMISRGMSVSGYKNKQINNSLTRLRRHNMIHNVGTRANPSWTIVETTN